MAFYILRRLLAVIPVMLVVAIFVFLLIRLGPGDPAAQLAGDAATAEDIQRIRERLGLHLPIHIQFISWFGNILQGDLGISIATNRPVSSLILARLEPTLALTLTTIIFVVLVAVPLGAIAAWKHGGWIDRSVMLFSVLGFSIPVFVLAYILIFVFAMTLGLAPVQGYVSPTRSIYGFFAHMALPVLSLSTIYIALIARITRATVVETLSEDYIRTAYSKGVRDREILLKHALRNSWVPIITVIGISVAALIGGVVVTESVYNIPGLGRLTVDAVLASDYPVIQGLILVFSFTYVLINLVVDITYAALDPRIRY
jgi:peptide/nickel transport system permease protein